MRIVILIVGLSLGVVIGFSIGRNGSEEIVDVRPLPLDKPVEFHGEYAIEILDEDMCLLRALESNRIYHIPFEHIDDALIVDNL